VKITRRTIKTHLSVCLMEFRYAATFVILITAHFFRDKYLVLPIGDFNLVNGLPFNTDGAIHSLIGIWIYYKSIFIVKTMSQRNTRSSSRHSVYGSSLPELPLNVLPTRRHVAQHILFLKERKFCSNKDIVTHVAQVLTRWNQASIPAQPPKNVKTKLVRFMSEVSVSVVSVANKLPRQGILKIINN